jgi:hypothetical protein
MAIYMDDKLILFYQESNIFPNTLNCLLVLQNVFYHAQQVNQIRNPSLVLLQIVNFCLEGFKSSAFYHWL